MSAYSIDVLVETELPGSVAEPAARSRIHGAAAATLRQADAPASASLSVVLANNDLVRRMNRDFRQIDKPTDVLSFPAAQDVPGLEDYLGDVVIAVPVAAEQAAAAGHAFVAELSLLVVHGVLHLLGHDHLDADEKARMWAAQDAVLDGLGLDLRSPEVEERS